MNKKIIVTLLSFILLNSSFAGKLIDKFQERRQERLENKIQKEENQGIVAGMNISNRNYLDIAYGSSKKQKLDVYLPSSVSNGKIILMVHGGAWKIGDKRHDSVITNKVKYFGAKGYTIVSVNYDLVPSITVEQQVMEIAQALQYVQYHAENWSADGSKVILMGHSAGAHLVSLLSTNKLLYSAKYPILGTVSLDSAVYNLPAIMEKPNHYGFYDDVFGINQDYWKKMSPYYQIDQKIKPMYLVCSTLREESCEQANNFSIKAKSLGSLIYVDRENKKHEEINDLLGMDLIYTQKVEKFMESLN